jgi:hypothetical protein
MGTPGRSGSWWCRQTPRCCRRRGWAGAVLLGLIVEAVAPAGAVDPAPVIVHVSVPPRVRAGEASEIRLAYRAPEGNVVAVLEAFEDLDGPPDARATREREVGVVARAFGRERGELILPFAFATPGWKRVTLTLVTDARALSDPAVVELEIQP